MKITLIDVQLKVYAYTSWDEKPLAQIPYNLYYVGMLKIEVK